MFPSQNNDLASYRIHESPPLSTAFGSHFQYLLYFKTMKKESGADPVFPRARYGQPVPSTASQHFCISENSSSHTRTLLNRENILLFKVSPWDLAFSDTSVCSSL